MNIVRLNTTAPDNVIVKGNGGNAGGYTSGMKYYDCLFDEEIQSTHGDYYVDNEKVMNTETGDVYIYPESYYQNARSIAVAVDVTNRKCYVDGQWMTYKDFLKNEDFGDAFDIDTHIEITEEEFYHIPEDEVWQWYGNMPEDNKVQFDKLMALCKRYGREKIQINTLPLCPWFKSLDVETDDGYDSYNVQPQYISDFVESSGASYIRFHTDMHEYDFAFLLKDGKYSIINEYQIEDEMKTIFIWADYGDREGVFNQFEAICQENVGNVNASGVALSDYYPIHLFEFCDEYDCSSRELDRIVGYEKDGDTTRIRIKTKEFEEIIELVRDGGAYSGTINGEPLQ